MKLRTFSTDGMTMPVSAVHYLSDGKAVGAIIAIPATLGHKWRQIQEHDCTFGAKVIGNEVQLTIDHPAGGTFIEQVVPVGPNIRKGVVRIIKAFDSARFKLWLEQQLRGDGDEC